MRANEVKETREVVVRTEYIAEDGTVFRSEEECKKYEESALFAISKELKRLTKDNTSQYEINDNFSCDDTVEIFDVQTERDLENLRRYLYLKMRKNGASEDSVKECFTSKNGKRDKYVFDGVTLIPITFCPSVHFIRYSLNFFIFAYLLYYIILN